MISMTNVPALNTHRNLAKAGKAKAVKSQRLSSGKRINTAADDAAGLAISKKMKSQIRGLIMAQRNVQDAISLMQTAEGGLSGISEMVGRIRELVVQASNDTLNHDGVNLMASDRVKIQEEIDTLIEGINQFSGTTQFNNMTLLDGSFAMANPPVIDTSLITPAAQPYMDYTVALPEPATIEPTIMPMAIGASASPPTTYEEIDTLSFASGVSQSGAGWNFDGTVLNITDNGAYKITGDGAVNALDRINVQNGTTADIILNDINIKTDAGPALDMGGSTVNLWLEGTNRLETTKMESASLRSNGGVLVIDGTGELTAICSNISAHGAGIGGSTMENGGTIKINGGVVNADNKGAAAGIGGGYFGSGGVITISGGHVNAVSSEGAAIGSGALGGDGGYITINDAVVNAFGYTGAAIGGGAGGDGGNITINSGVVTAIGSKAPDGSIVGNGGAAIGGGNGKDGGNITINGGVVTATGNGWATAIGGGYRGDGGNITINGGVVTATQGYNVAAIGGGSDNYSSYNPGSGANLTVSGGILEILAGWIGGGTGSSGHGTTHITGGALVIDDPANKIRSGVTNSAGQYSPVADSTQLYMVSVLPSEIGFNFPSEQPIKYVVNGQDTYTWLTDPIPHNNSLYLFSPDESAAGEKTSIDIYYGGKIYKGYAEVQQDHSSIWYLDSIESDPTAPPIPPVIPPNPPITPPNPPIKPPDPPIKPPDSDTLGNKPLWFQTGANEGQGISVYIEKVDAVSLGLMNTNSSSVINVLHKSGADITGLLGTVDSALSMVLTERAKIGATQNRLEFSMRSLEISGENLSAAESRISDADMAKEMMGFVRENVLEQAAMSMMSQANQNPKSVLALLQ